MGPQHVDKTFQRYAGAGDPVTGHLGVAARAVEPDQLHCGLIYRRSDQIDHRLLHLEWVDRLRDDPVPDGCFVARSGFGDENQRLVARLCSKVSNIHGRSGAHFPWGFEFSGDGAFQPSGEWLGNNPVALTCATFVAAIFASVNLPLVAFDSWPERAEDAAWAREKAAKLPIGQVAKAPRVRPEEIAVAVTICEKETPVSYDAIGPESTVLERRLRDQYTEHQRRRFGAQVGDAIRHSDLAGLLQRGLRPIPKATTATFAQQLRQGQMMVGDILDALALALLRLLPPTMVSEAELDEAATDRRKLAGLTTRVQDRTGTDLVEAARDALGAAPNPPPNSAGI